MTNLTGQCKDFPDETVMYIETLPPWTMYLDRAERFEGAGVGITFLSPQRKALPFVFMLNQ